MSVEVAERVKTLETEGSKKNLAARVSVLQKHLPSRFELKFLVTLKEGEKIINDLRHYMTFDSYTDSIDRYTVQSLYLDTDDHKDYHDVINGEKKRCKFRFRKYGSATSKIALEAKQKYNQTINKTRVWVDSHQIDIYWKDPFASPESHELFAFNFARHRYKPLVAINYQRVPLVDLLGHNIRVTLDFNLRCNGPESFLNPDGKPGLLILPPGHGILEVKFDERMPQWLRTCLRRNHLVARPYSKYVKAVDRYVYNQPLIEELSQSWMSF